MHVGVYYPLWWLWPVNGQAGLWFSLRPEIIFKVRDLMRNLQIPWEVLWCIVFRLTLYGICYTQVSWGIVFRLCLGQNSHLKENCCVHTVPTCSVYLAHKTLNYYHPSKGTFHVAVTALCFWYFLIQKCVMLWRETASIFHEGKLRMFWISMNLFWSFVLLSGSSPEDSIVKRMLQNVFLRCC